MEKDQPEIESTDKKKYNRALFYDVFLGRPQQAEEIADFVFWLHSHYRSPFLAKNKKNNEGPLTGLDIGCGLGRMFREFTSRGWHVWGYEPDEDYCNMSLAVSLEADLADRFRPTGNSIMSVDKTSKVVVERKGFLELDVHNVFDMVIAINGPFYYMLKVEERIQALRNVFDSLKPGGIVFLDLANFLFYLANYNPTSARKPQVIEHNQQEFTRVPAIKINWHEATWDHTDQFLVDGVLIYEETHRFAMCTLPDLMYQLKLVGFDNIQTFNSWQSRQNEQIDGPRMLVAAQKPYLYKESDTTQ